VKEFRKEDAGSIEKWLEHFKGAAGRLPPPQDIVVITSNEEMIPLLRAAGYQAVPTPDSDADIIEKRLPSAAHYVVSVCGDWMAMEGMTAPGFCEENHGNSQALAEDLAGMEFCNINQISLSDLSCYRFPAGMAKRRLIEVVHAIIGQAAPYVITILD
jgi:hypothetical protein